MYFCPASGFFHQLRGSILGNQQAPDRQKSWNFRQHGKKLPLSRISSCTPVCSWLESNLDFISVSIFYEIN